jgi:ABC-type bacteriocin/lantibiotic exporter with double-glycine peptidase domain
VGIVGVVVVMGRGAVGTATAESKAKYEVVHWLEELARHPGTFRASSQRRYARRRMDGLASGYVRARRTHYRIVFRQFAAALTLQVVASSALLALGGMLVVQGQLTLGQLVASELIITTIVAAVAKFGKQLESFYDLLAAMDKLSHLADLPLERPSGGDLENDSGPAEVILADVDFAYESNTILLDFDLHIEPGEKVAVRGAMGSGKSTLLDLLAGLREPLQGSVSLDDKDYRDIRLEELRESAVLVRSPEIFSGTVIENLQVGRSQYGHGEILAALEAVGLLEEIRMLPGGLKSRLSTDGRPLSQVQIARLMIARAILGQPRLLLLDRALEHLDDEARGRICEVLFAEDSPWTLVVVTEREDILRYCTRQISLGEPEIWKARMSSSNTMNPSDHRASGKSEDASP